MEYLEIFQISFKAKMMLNKSFLNPILLHLYLLCQSLNRMSDYISTGLQVNMLSVKVYIAKLYPADAWYGNWLLMTYVCVGFEWKILLLTCLTGYFALKRLWGIAVMHAYDLERKHHFGPFIAHMPDISTCVMCSWMNMVCLYRALPCLTRLWGEGRGVNSKEAVWLVGSHGGVCNCLW